MRILRQTVLVGVLTIAFVAAGVGWMRSYVPPLVEQAAAKPEHRGDVAEELPSVCLEELTSLENSATRPSRDEPSDSPRVARTLPSGDVLRSQLQLAAANASLALRRTRVTSGEPVRLPADCDAANPLRSMAEAPKTMAAQSAEWNAAVASPPDRLSSTRPPRATTLPVSVEETLPTAPPASLATTDVLDLMRRLRSDAEGERALARRELLRRGFGEVDLELAKQLVSPDAAVRRQLASALPRLASVDAVRWLMWLAADPQPDVRLAAITTLATTGDPALLDRVEALAKQDSDPQVQAVAEQVARQRDLASFRDRK